jgi:hypothetical protein
MSDDPFSDAARSDDADARALARRLRDDPAATRRLDELRRAAFGRDGSTAPLVEVPAPLRARTGVDAVELPVPLVALLAEEARLTDEGAGLLAADAPGPSPRRRRGLRPTAALTLLPPSRPTTGPRRRGRTPTRGRTRPRRTRADPALLPSRPSRPVSSCSRGSDPRPPRAPSR